MSTHNRVIKFRAFDKSTKKWAHGDRVGVSLNGNIIDAHGKTLMDEVFEDHLIAWNENLTISQFTGLLDRNGVEIYEGDVVDSFHEKWPKERPGDYRANGTPAREVKWITSPHHNGWNVYFAKKTQLEVIGNVYEHPNLSNNITGESK